MPWIIPIGLIVAVIFPGVLASIFGAILLGIGLFSTILRYTKDN